MVFKFDNCFTCWCGCRYFSKNMQIFFKENTLEYVPLFLHQIVTNVIITLFRIFFCLFAYLQFSYKKHACTSSASNRMVSSAINDTFDEW